VPSPRAGRTSAAELRNRNPATGKRKGKIIIVGQSLVRNYRGAATRMRGTRVAHSIEPLRALAPSAVIGGPSRAEYPEQLSGRASSSRKEREIGNGCGAGGAPRGLRSIAAFCTGARITGDNRRPPLL
jgi:hypothetical protein